MAPYFRAGAVAVGGIVPGTVAGIRIRGWGIGNPGIRPPVGRPPIGNNRLQILSANTALEEHRLMLPAGYRAWCKQMDVSTIPVSNGAMAVSDPAPNVPKSLFRDLQALGTARAKRAPCEKEVSSRSLKLELAGTSQIERPRPRERGPFNAYALLKDQNRRTDDP